MRHQIPTGLSPIDPSKDKASALEHQTLYNAVIVAMQPLGVDVVEFITPSCPPETQQSSRFTLLLKAATYASRMQGYVRPVTRRFS